MAEYNPASFGADLFRTLSEGRPGMFAGETYAAVRRFVFVEGKSRRTTTLAPSMTSIQGPLRRAPTRNGRNLVRSALMWLGEADPDQGAACAAAYFEG
jgi:hypothetical protein